MGILTTPVKFDKSDYISLLSLSAGAAIARQNKLGELVVGENGWNIDGTGGLGLARASSTAG